MEKKWGVEFLKSIVSKTCTRYKTTHGTTHVREIKCKRETKNMGAR